ncbi:serine/threonine-protein kinase [Tsukamurella ocularis]
MVRQLGAGGMGQVFLVEHPRLPRQDALKLLDSGVSRNDDFKVRFQREADLLAQLSHPNIVTLHDRGEFEDRLWITMEYVDGTDASELVKVDGPLDPDLAIQLTGGAGAALDYAWRKQRITHRDVKPANILVGIDGADGAPQIESIKLADFGIAKAAGEATSLTSTGITVGTMQYISPEAIEGEGLDNRADVYSLGCTAFHLLTGRPPYTGTSITALMNAHLTQAPPRMSDVAPRLPDSFDAVFAKVLAKTPGDRFQSCAEFVAALQEAAEADVDPAFARTAVAASPARGAVAMPDAPTEVRAVDLMPQRTSRAVPILVAVVVVLAIAATSLGVFVLTRGNGDGPPVAAPSADTGAAGVSTTTPAPTTTTTTTSAPAVTSIVTRTTTVPATSSAAAAPVAGERAFLTSTSSLPMYVRPNGRYTTDAEMLAGGYRACRMLDQNPTDATAATRAYFPGGNQVDGGLTYEGKLFVLYAAQNLCPQHAHLYENF